METEIIRIKCPSCCAVLSAKKMVGLETKIIPCPICKKSSHFSVYQKPNTPLLSIMEDDKTNIGCETIIRDKGLIIGKLVVQYGRQDYPLKLGVNTIGRKAVSSVATVQIVTEDKTMSRQHAIIEVNKTAKGYTHRLRNHQNKNATYVNSQLIGDGDVVVLSGGVQIKMGDTLLLFVLE